MIMNNKNKLIIAGVAVLAVVIAVVVLVIMAVNRNSLTGTWLYEDGTRYRFDEDNTGAMILGDYEYKYTYKISGNKVKINYERSEVHDAEYTFEINGDKLTLHGGEGTAGGDYDLSRFE